MFFYRGRFRIVKSATEQNGDRPVNHHECQLYHVEEIIDDNIQQSFIKPKSNHRKKCSESENNDDNDFDCDKDEKRSESDIYYKNHSTMIQKISKISQIPHCALNKVWPWKLAEDIIYEIASNETLHGLFKSLPASSGRVIIQSSKKRKESDKDDVMNTNVALHHLHKNIQYYIDRSQFNPVSFSYWVAANLPLSQTSKLDVLEMNHVERLRFLLDKLIQQRDIVRYIKCKHCGSKIAKMGNLFTVAGAEGTSGAYGKLGI